MKFLANHTIVIGKGESAKTLQRGDQLPRLHADELLRLQDLGAITGVDDTAASEKAEAERAAAAQAEAVREAAQKAEAERKAAAQAAADRLAAEQAEAERKAVAQAEADRKAVAEADAQKAGKKA